MRAISSRLTRAAAVMPAESFDIARPGVAARAAGDLDEVTPSPSEECQILRPRHGPPVMTFAPSTFAQLSLGYVFASWCFTAQTGL